MSDAARRTRALWSILCHVAYAITIVSVSLSVWLITQLILGATFTIDWP